MQGHILRKFDTHLSPDPHANAFLIKISLCILSLEFLCNCVHRQTSWDFTSGLASATSMARASHNACLEQVLDMFVKQARLCSSDLLVLFIYLL